VTDEQFILGFLTVYIVALIGIYLWSVRNKR
jgi:hypothetical protein